MTRGGAPAWLAMALALAAVGAGRAGERVPFVRLPELARPYAGPGRETPPPAGALAEVPLGWFGPADAGDRGGGLAWAGALLAIEEANAEGGLDGVPFRLLPCWAENPWGTGVARLTRLIYDDHIWALIGSVTGDATHLAEQVVAKARVAMVSPIATDKSVNLANVSWTFSLAPPDDLLARAVAETLAGLPGPRPVALLSSTSHDSRCAAIELYAALRTRDTAVALHLTFAPGIGDSDRLGLQLERTMAARPGALIVIGSAAESARALRALRGAGYDGPVLGWASMGRSACLEEAGAAAANALFPVLFHPERTPAASAFCARFSSRTGRAADYTAASSYDAARLVVAAIRKAGLNRARIRDALAGLSPWEGVCGPVAWDATGRNRPQVAMGTAAGEREPLFSEGE